jgi:hypothetical protein
VTRQAEGIETRTPPGLPLAPGRALQLQRPSHRGKVVVPVTGERVRSKWTTDPRRASRWRREH